MSHELLKRMLKGQSDVGGDENKEKYFKTQAMESQNLLVFFGML